MHCTAFRCNVQHDSGLENNGDVLSLLGLPVVKMRQNLAHALTFDRGVIQIKVSRLVFFGAPLFELDLYVLFHPSYQMRVLKRPVLGIW